MNNIKDLVQNNSPLREAIKPLNPYIASPIKQKQADVMKKFASYMKKDIFHKWKAQALSEGRRDYKILEDAIELYIKNKNA